VKFKDSIINDRCPLCGSKFHSVAKRMRGCGFLVYCNCCDFELNIVVMDNIMRRVILDIDFLCLESVELTYSELN